MAGVTANNVQVNTKTVFSVLNIPVVKNNEISGSKTGKGADCIDGRMWEWDEVGLDRLFAATPSLNDWVREGSWGLYKLYKTQ